MEILERSFQKFSPELLRLSNVDIAVINEDSFWLMGSFLKTQKIFRRLSFLPRV